MNTEPHESIVRPLHPLWLIPVSLVGGLLTSGPFAGAALHRCGYRKLGWLLGAALSVLDLLILALCGLRGQQWYWVALTASSIHLAAGIALFVLIRKPYHNFQAEHPPLVSDRGNYRNVLTGMIGGGLLGALLGTMASVLYVLLSDRLWSTFMPVDFDDSLVMLRVILEVVFMTLSGVMAGGLLGRTRPGATPMQILLYGLLLVWTQTTWILCIDATIAIPAFQAHSATMGGWSALITPFVLLELAIGCWWTVLLVLFTLAHPRLGGKFRRGGLVFAANLAAAVTISISLGYSADLLLGLGKHFERTARTATALWCYEQGLRKEPKPQVASYLQYRVALLNHKLGQEEKARQGFNRVVAKHTWNQELVKKANRFLDNLEHRSGGKRVVLPGVETRTAYKGGYCVPNSLALVMRYWGKDISAVTIGKRITGLGRGTIVVDQRWFAEQEGWRHDFLPLAGVDDIKRCIDAGLPVLVYVPAHVFAIVGYDDILETFVTYDVATRDIWEEYIQSDFVKSWKRQATTLVLSYPPEKQSMIPDDIRERLANLSDNYLHFHLHYLDRPGDSPSIPHLAKAAGDGGAFFLPVTVLYSEFPGLRASLDKQYDVDKMAEAIKAYFWSGFDEGIHEAGQRHDEHWARPDWALGSAVSYLIGNHRFELVDALISRIHDQGQVSRKMLAEVGLMDLSQGDFEQGLDRIQNGDHSHATFYAGLAKLKLGDVQGATQELAKTIQSRA